MAFGYSFWFDQEMIYTASDYQRLINDLADTVELQDRLAGVSAESHQQGREMTIRYVLDQQPRELTFEQPSDWIPSAVRDFLLNDLGADAGWLTSAVRRCSSHGCCPSARTRSWRDPRLRALAGETRGLALRVASGTQWPVAGARSG